MINIVVPRGGLKLGPSRTAVFEDYKATALTTQPPGLSIHHIFHNFKIKSLQKHVKRVKQHISTIAWSAEHPNAG